MKSSLNTTARAALCFGVISVLASVNAEAKTNLVASYESGKYESDYSYSGPRIDMTLNPDGSNWYFNLGYRNRTHDSKQVYIRADSGAAYRFRFNRSWIQPSVKIRQDITNYDSGSRLTTDFYKTETKYVLDLNSQWALWGEIDFGLARQEDKNVSGTVRNSDYITWEVEPGVRYSFSKNLSTTLAYYNTGERSDKGETWGLTDNTKNHQARWYLHWRAPMGFVVSPYIRYSLDYGKTSSWYESASFPETATKSKVARYAMRLAYSISSSVQLQAEYYFEDLQFKEGYAMGKDDSQMQYLKLGVRASF